MLPRRLRLPRAGFVAPRSAKRSISEHFSLSVYKAQPQLGGCAVVVPKKAVPNAVDRHRLKRQITEFLIPFANQKEAKTVFARKKAETLTNKQLKEELQKLFGGV